MIDPPGGAPRNIRLLLEYDGTPFHGWQIQPHTPTIQELLEKALFKITGAPTSLRASGRTDAGVHAVGQVANFFTRSRIEAGTYAAALNSLLPAGIAVRESREAAPDFDARFSAVAKTYRYLILNRRVRSPLEARRSWHIASPLRLAAMRKSLPAFTGTMDFSSFRSSGCTARTPVRTLFSLILARRGDLLIIDARGDGFLRHMVRAIVGTLAEVGLGRFSPDEIPAIAAARDRSRAGRTSPPHGLYLLSVEYPPPVEWEASPGRLTPLPG